jgi:excisionase family DNA binding protein
MERSVLEKPRPEKLTVRIATAVQMTGICRSKVYELIKSGDIEVIKVGSATLIPVDSIRAFLEAHRQPKPAE